MQSAAVERGRQTLAQLGGAPSPLQRQRVPLLTGGLRTDKQPDNLAPNEAVQIDGLVVFESKLIVDTGYTPFPGTYLGLPQLPFQIFWADGSNDLLLVTTETVYKYDPDHAQWQLIQGWPKLLQWTTSATAAGSNSFILTDVTPFVTSQQVLIFLDSGRRLSTTISTINTGTNTITTAAAVPSGDNVSIGNSFVGQPPTIAVTGGPYSPGTTAFPVSSTQTLAATGLIGITQHDGSQLISTISSIVGSTLHLAHANTVQVDTGAAVAPAYPLNGDVSSQASAQAIVSVGSLESSTSVGVVTFSNGRDPVFYYDRKSVQKLPGLPPETSCQVMLLFHETLLLASMIEGGVQLPYRVRMSDQADPFSWTPLIGIAAIYDLPDTEDFILALEVLGPWVICYRESTIMRASYLGLPNQTLFWEYMVYGEGIASQGAVSPIGSLHAFVGLTGIYLYDGGYSLTSIGDGVFYGFLSTFGDLNPSARNTLFTQYDGEHDDLFIFYPSEMSTVPNKILRCSIGESGGTSDDSTAWFTRSLNDSFIGSEPFVPLEVTTWANAVGTWAQQTAQWNSRLFSSNVAPILLCPTTRSTLEVYDYASMTDDGDVISWKLQTGQLLDGAKEYRTDRLVLMGTGQVTISYVTTEQDDPGSSPNWQLLGTVQLGTTRAMPVMVNLVTVTPYLMLLLQGTDHNFSLQWIDLYFQEESEWMYNQGMVAGSFVQT